MSEAITSIRPFAEADRERVVELWNEAFPFESTTVEQLAHDDAAVKPPRRAGRLVAESRDGIVGLADFEQPVGTFDPGTYWLRIYVAPEARGAGVGAALYDEVSLLLSAFDPERFRVFWKEDHPVAAEFAGRRGFVEDKRDWEMVLDLTEFDADSHRSFLERAIKQGLTISSLEQWGDATAIGPDFHEFFRQVRQDVPRNEPLSDLSYQEFTDYVLEAPDLIRDATFFVFDGDAPVAMTMSWFAGDPLELHTGLTATLGSHRGRGLATALKVTALSWAKEQGRVRAVTENDVHNVEMLTVNRKLGYVQQPALISGVRELTPR
ncbi:MAG: GNAT family N-acetyltransferase [Acidimicrobiales bacterium]|nr:GNAT family N-acetyltransferase [Acidimicrobiales bacterium]RZV42794.1 MAG: GNAT family N-acetyltransferase [Acidimicrobiales bacterium]